MNRTGINPEPSLALLTDLYQLTMAYGYWKTGNLEKEGIFNLFFRKNPFDGGFTLACGLASAIELFEKFGFSPSDIDYLGSICGNNGKPIFEKGFLQYLDEHIITSLKQQGARINLWGVGTRLATGHDKGALGGVYKLVALRDPEKTWQHRIKLSEQKIKITTPGELQIRRYIYAGEAKGDMTFDLLSGMPEHDFIIDPEDHTRRKTMPGKCETVELLQPTARSGKIVAEKISIHKIRERAASEQTLFHEGIRRFVNPHVYPVGLEEKLFALKNRMILENRKIHDWQKP
ncbi:MAG TPA: hypothetical protein PLK58_03880 [Candidatus Rifleibacterium sp.]|jgi:nicotinic acid phosphoribosyltransferase|nr:hypothetical protein [Candidatus Rifleibacterium sp.]HPW57755.1 hypothetical protein [Candidatus Rifleibacterium sp.]